MDVTTQHIFSPFEPRQDNLTFGLELEFAIAYIPPNGQNPNPRDPRQVTGIVTGPRKTWIANLRKHIAATLRSAGISAVASSPYSDDPTRGSEPFWSVKHDDTIKGPQLEGHLFLPIEITSPPFYFGTDEPFREIETVCKVLKENYIISCNRSCGVHVHVGNRLDGFKYEAMQNLLAIIWTFEPQIETIHPLHRVNNLQICPSFRRWSELSRVHTSRESGKLNARAGLEELLDLTNMNDFQLFFDLSEPRNSEAQLGGSKLAYHFGDVGAERHLSVRWKRTVEFRQHRSTLDFEELWLWINFCVQLVMFADSTDQKKLSALLRKCVDKSKEELPLEQVLWKMGMVQLAENYPKKIAENAAVVVDEEEILYLIVVGMSEKRSVPV